MGFRKIVGRNVRRLRQQKGWTQQELAERLERHKQTVWAIEAGRHGINDRLMDDLARVFGVPYTELLRKEPEANAGAAHPSGGTSRKRRRRDGGEGYVAEVPLSGADAAVSVAVTTPEQIREWIRQAAREAVQAATASLEGRREPSSSDAAGKRAGSKARPEQQGEEGFPSGGEA